jgi:hypothetical protein
MEISIDKRAFYVIGAVIGICFLYLLYLAGSFLFGLVGGNPSVNPNNSSNGTVTLESICAQKSAMQMFIQNPKSNHPYVIKLRNDIAIFNQKDTFKGCN